MSKTFKYVGLPIALLGVAALASTAYAQKKTFVSIGANPVGLTAYQWAAGISDLANRKVGGIKANAEATKGYVANIRLLLNKKIEAGFSNSKVAYDAYAAKGAYKNDKKGQILSWISVAPIAMHVFTLEGSPIKTLQDLKGKRVGMGQPGGTSMLDAETLFSAIGLKPGTDFKDFRIKLGKQVNMLGDGQLDAAIWNGSMPLPPVIKLKARRKVSFIEIPDAVSAKIRKKAPPYYEYDIPANTYPAQPKAINSYGLGNVLLVRADISEKIVYGITKAIMENLGHMKSVHPAWGKVSKSTILRGFSAPVHPGALKYYREANVPGIEAFVKRTTQ